MHYNRDGFINVICFEDMWTAAATASPYSYAFMCVYINKHDACVRVRVSVAGCCAGFTQLNHCCAVFSSQKKRKKVWCVWHPQSTLMDRMRLEDDDDDSNISNEIEGNVYAKEIEGERIHRNSVSLHLHLEILRSHKCHIPFISTRTHTHAHIQLIPFLISIYLRRFTFN